MLDSCNKSSDVYDELYNIIKTVPLAKIKKDLSHKFYNADDVIEFLYSVVLAKGNGILYGPGGFGKSMITKEFFNYLGIPVNVKVGHSAMDVESLLGIPNIKKLTEESTYEVAFEKSIFGLKGVLILEEFLDVRPTVAAALKDIITEGGFRDKDGFIHALNGPIFICSNKSPDDVVTDLSTAAFYEERFPYKLHVVWDSYSHKDYKNLFKLYRQDIEDDVIEVTSRLCSISSSEHKIISPRVALKALELFNETKDINSFKMISGIDVSKIDEVISDIRKSNTNKILSEVIDKLSLTILQKGNTNDELLASKYILLGIKDKLSKIFVEDDDLVERISVLINSIDIQVVEIDKQLYTFGSISRHLVKDLNFIYEDLSKLSSQR